MTNSRLIQFRHFNISPKDHFALKDLALKKPRVHVGASVLINTYFGKADV